ncbi:unnamed protein product [Arabis nemorensis]|uniref:Uncharacterized protein n=1 Tax=Arabis nemorensis TaxID=586526 RepID=A0A565CVT3_9BRAS|nr:unnamed protein product [Arabis nemorensis]
MGHNSDCVVAVKYVVSWLGGSSPFCVGLCVVLARSYLLKKEKFVQEFGTGYSLLCDDEDSVYLESGGG